MTHPLLRLLPKIQVDPEEAAVDAAVDAALETDFRRTVAALRRPISAVADEHGAEVGAVGADDAENWWINVAVPVLTEVAKRVVLTEPGQSPAAVVDAAILDVISWLLEQHEEAETAAGALPPAHPARLKRLVLIVASASEPQAVRDHALAMALVFSGAAARVVSGPITRQKLKQLIKLTQPAVIVVPKCPHALDCPDGARGPSGSGRPSLRCPERQQIEALADLFPHIPVVEAPATTTGGSSFTALVNRVLAKVPAPPDDDAVLKPA